MNRQGVITVQGRSHDEPDEVEGVPTSCSLHSSLLFPANLLFRVSMGKPYKERYHSSRITGNSTVSAEPWNKS